MSEQIKIGAALKVFSSGLGKKQQNDFEKFTSAHYVARYQMLLTDKIKVGQMVLQLALKINDESMKENFPSLYLTIARCHEELKDFDNAKRITI